MPLFTDLPANPFPSHYTLETIHKLLKAISETSTPTNITALQKKVGVGYDSLAFHLTTIAMAGLVRRDKSKRFYLNEKGISVLKSFEEIHSSLMPLPDAPHYLITKKQIEWNWEPWWDEAPDSRPIKQKSRGPG